MASSMDKLAKELKKQMTASDERKPKPYDTQAEVLRVENGIAWVHIPGGVDETPVRLTINAKKGDNVNLHVANGTAWITGNSTNPPTDDSTANYAVDISNEVKKDITVLNTVVAENIEATNARFINVEADTAKIHTLTAEKILATVGYIEDLTADSITVEDISAASGYIKDLEADNITAQDISASSGYIKDLTAGNVTAQNVIADHATVGSLDANYAKVNAANIDTAAIRNAWVDKIMVQTGLLAYSSQIYTLDAIEVNAANITAGTLDVNRLIVTVGEGSSAQKYLVNIDPSTGTPSYEKLDGNIVEPRTITANKIVANSITTDEITVNNLVGTSGWINLHEGKFFYGNGADFATATNAISWNGSKLQIKADEFLLSTGKTIQDSIESVENWFYSVPPTTSNPPANSWTTTNLKEQHLRDIYFDTTSGKSYRWAKEGSTYKWVEIEDVELAALANDLHNNYPPRSEFTVAPDQIQAVVTNETNARKAIYGTCSTTAGTAAKVVTCANFARYTGAVVTVKFANANTATTPTLNINSTGAATIKSYTGAALSEAEYKWAAGAALTFLFDGTYWRLQDSGSTAQIKVNADNINLRVQKNDVINQINVSTEGAQIKASKVDIAGSTVFNNYSTTAEMNDAIGGAVDGIEVGGRNLLLDSEAMSSWYTASGVSISGGVATLVGSSSNWNSNLSTKKYDASLYDGQTTYTWSFEYKSSMACTLGPVISGTAQSIDSSSWSRTKYIGWTSTFTLPSSGGVWTKYTLNPRTIALSDLTSGSGDVVNGYLQLYCRTNNANLQVRHHKLEKGNKATDWSPAPEDVQAEIDAKKSVHTINATGTDASKPYATIMAWAEEGRELTFSVDSTAGIKAGDTVRIKILVSDMGTESSRPSVYVVTTCRETPTSSTSLKTTSHGLDTTIIDGGNILTNSITANQIATNAIKAEELDTDNINNSGLLSTGALTVGAKSEVLNSNVEVGGRNLLLNSANMPLVSSGIGGYRASGGTASHITITNPPISGISGGIRITNSGTSAARIGLAQDRRYSTFVAGEKYSQSFWIRASTSFASTVEAQPIWGARDQTTGSVSKSMTLTTSWQYVKGEGATLQGTQADYYSAGYVYASNVPVGAYIEVCADKVEKGTKATDWTPSPEDEIGKNLLSYPYLRDSLSGATYTTAGITFTLNDDGTVTAKGTATGNAWYQFTSNYYPNTPNGAFCLPAGTYTFSGCPSGGASTTYFIQFNAYNGSSSSDTSFVGGRDYGDGYTAVLTKAGYIRFEIGIMNGYACPSAGITFKPMLEAGATAHAFVSPSATEAAAQSATKYITRINDNGIRIHPASTENNSAVINADGLEIFKGGTTKAYSVAKYGDTARIGKESGSHLTLAPDSMSMSTGTKDVFNLLQKTMYIYWTRNYKGRQFANSTDRHVDSWETNTTISTWDSIAVNYKLNNTSRTKKITSISNGVLANDEIYVHFNYSGTKITLTYGRGSSAASSDIIKLESAVVYYVTDEHLSQLHTGTYPNTAVSGALRIGNGTSDSNRINLMLVDWSGTGKFKGDILTFCGADSSGGMSLTKAEENIDAFKYEDANGHVYIDAYRVGRIVSLLCIVSKTASIAPGANLYLLDLTNAHLPKPLGTNTSGTGISGKNMIIGNIYYNKTVTPNRYEFVCRNGGSTAVQTGGVGFTITYICQMDEVSGEIKYMDD